jgi:hypothetical protein
MRHTSPFAHENCSSAESRARARGSSLRHCHLAAFQARGGFRIEIAKGFDLKPPCKEPPQDVGRLDWWRRRSESMEPRLSKRIDTFVHEGHNLGSHRIGGGSTRLA